MQSSSSLSHVDRIRSHDSHGAWAHRDALAEDARGERGKPNRGIGALATSMRDLVRDTVYVTFDALRGRYDR